MHEIEEEDYFVNDEWEKFMETGGYNNNDVVEQDKTKVNTPKCGDIYISTKTKIVYLNKTNIDLTDIFWKIEIMDYGTYDNGVIKKQKKFNSLDKIEIEIIEEKLSKYSYTNSYIIQSIDNPDGRIKFKDIRKVTVGMSKRDLINYRVKEKGAFYNCFVLILRVKVNSDFNEYHIKIFNTGKIEIPGIKTDVELNIILDNLLKILMKHIKENLDINRSNMETVLVNSNFDCKFYLNRDKLYNILKTKYGIQSVFDPCSYPGIQSRIFFDDNDNLSNDPNKGKVSFMIFRTGSVLIVGKCNMIILNKIYNHIKDILMNEYNNICEMNKVETAKVNVKKKYKKYIMVDS